MIASFKDSYSGYCLTGEEFLPPIQLVIVTMTMVKNTAKTNSKTCINLLGKSSYKLTGDSNNYGIGIAVEPVGCVNLNGEFDETCKCKKFVDAKGSNACQKDPNHFTKRRF